MAIGCLVVALALIICLIIVGVTTNQNSSDKVDFVLDSNSSPPDISGSYEKTTSGGQLEYQMQVYDDGTYGESHSLKGRPYTSVYAYVYYVEAGTGVYYSATENRLFRIIGRVSDHYFTSYEIDDDRLVPRDLSSIQKSEYSVGCYVIENGDLIDNSGRWKK